MKNEETAGASRGSRVPDRFHGRARFVSFAGAAPALSLNFPPCRRTKETDGNGKHATPGIAAGDACARLTPPPRSMGGEISICDTRGSRQNKSRSGHEATINRALPPAIRLCAICRNARRTRKLRSGIHGVRFASFRASLRGGSRSMKETRQAPRSASRLAICSVFRVSHEYSAFNGRLALVTLKISPGRLPAVKAIQATRSTLPNAPSPTGRSYIKSERSSRDSPEDREAKLRVTWPRFFLFSPLGHRGRDGEGVLSLGYSERVN